MGRFKPFYEHASLDGIRQIWRRGQQDSTSGNDWFLKSFSAYIGMAAALAITTGVGYVCEKISFGDMQVPVILIAGAITLVGSVEGSYVGYRYLGSFMIGAKNSIYDSAASKIKAIRRG